MVLKLVDGAQKSWRRLDGHHQLIEGVNFTDGIDPARVPVVVGGIIPRDDALALCADGVARVFTPEDHDLTATVGEMADLVCATLPT